MAQVILYTVNAYNAPVTYTKISKVMKQSGVKVSSFVLKKVLKQLLKKKVLKHEGTQYRYVSTGKRVPGSAVNKKKRMSKKMKKEDRKFRQKLRRLARKSVRGGRTYAEVVYDYIYVQRMSKTSDKKKKTRFSQISAFLRKNNMKISNFVLDKVLGRLREKHYIRLSKHRNVLTSKSFEKKSKK